MTDRHALTPAPVFPRLLIRDQFDMALTEVFRRKITHRRRAVLFSGQKHSPTLRQNMCQFIFQENRIYSE